MRRKLLLLPAFLLGSTSIYCAETLITRSGGGATGADGAVPSAHAEPTKFELISEGSFIGESEVISVEGAARVTVAVAISEKKAPPPNVG